MRTDEIYIYCIPSFVFGLCPWISPSAQWELAKLILRDIPPRAGAQNEHQLSQMDPRTSSLSRGGRSV